MNLLMINVYLYHFRLGIIKPDKTNKVNICNVWLEFTLYEYGLRDSTSLRGSRRPSG